jgi:hypothetical protein
MPVPTRPKRDPTDDWEQLRLWVTSLEQATYELLRPIVLFGRSPALRAAETGTPERTVRRRVARFEQRGMASLFETATPPTTDRRTLPAEIRQAILAPGALELVVGSSRILRHPVTPPPHLA